MTKKSGFENKVIRVPKNIRESLGFSLGEFIVLEDDTVLQVNKPYKQDIETYGIEFCFVTESTFNNIKTDNNCKFNIVNDITLGCDPELFLYNTTTGNLANALSWFRKWDPIGADGLLCELRPAPHTNPSVVTNNIYNMLVQVQHKINNVNPDIYMVAASALCGITAGFHCHLGIPKIMLNKRSKNYNTIIRTIVRSLDYHVGIPAVIPEGKEENLRRCAPFLSYGKVSDYRVDSRTLEYRVPSGILLKSPQLTEGLLATCLVAGTDVISKINHIYDILQDELPHYDTLVREIYPYIPNEEVMYDLICATTTELAEREVPSVVDSIQDMCTYNQYKPQIDTFFEYITNKNITNYLAFNWFN